MYQKDYILRMIEMLGELIAAILGYIKKGQFEEASISLDNLYTTLLREDSSFFQNIPKEQLTGKLINEHHYTNNHLEVLAELFNAEGELRLAQKKGTECIEYFNKSLLLFEFVETNSKSFSIERQNKIKTIKEKIEQGKLPAS